MAEAQTKKQQTHERMIKAASQGFRSLGYSGVGVDGIAKAAGATSGAFYAHFGSKDGAFRAALTAGLDEVIEGIPSFQRDHGESWVEAFADYYLGRPHQEDLACGCAMTTLTPEVARSGDELRTIYELKMTKIVSCAADGLSGKSRQDKEARAWAMFASLIGGLNIVRALGDKSAADNVASAIKAAAVDIAGPTCKTD